jgi:hypothetical protein
MGPKQSPICPALSIARLSSREQPVAADAAALNTDQDAKLVTAGTILFIIRRHSSV